MRIGLDRCYRWPILFIIVSVLLSIVSVVVPASGSLLLPGWMIISVTATMTGLGACLSVPPETGLRPIAAVAVVAGMVGIALLVSAALLPTPFGRDVTAICGAASIGLSALVLVVFVRALSIVLRDPLLTLTAHSWLVCLGVGGVLIALVACLQHSFHFTALAGLDTAAGITFTFVMFVWLLRLIRDARDTVAVRTAVRFARPVMEPRPDA